MNKIFLDMDGTIARFNVRNALARFATEKGFFRGLKPYVGIGLIDKLASKGNVYIVTASPNTNADLEKLEWIRENIPTMPLENIVICRIGMNKAEVVKQKLGIQIDKSCYLVDDYTKNLKEWETLGGVGIKRLTQVADNSTKKWKGLQIDKLSQLEKVVV